MTSDQFDAMAQLMRLRPSASREALRLVLVSGWTQQGAANSAGIPPSNVARQVASARRVIKAARVVVGNSVGVDALRSWLDGQAR